MEPCDLVVFGTQGDLARRKLIPSLYQLEKAELIAQDTTIVGVGRGESCFTSLARTQEARLAAEERRIGPGIMFSLSVLDSVDMDMHTSISKVAVLLGGLPGL